MKLLMVCGMDTVYGASRSFLGLIEQLSDKGYILAVITPKRCRINEYCDKCGITNCSIPYSNSGGNQKYAHIKRLLKDLNNCRCYLTLNHFLNNIKIDAVYSNDIDTLFGSYCATKMRLKHIWHIRSFGLEDYGTLYHYPMENYLNRADKCVAISYTVRDSWIKKGVYGEKIVTIYNGVSTSEILPREKLQGDRLRVIMSGNITATKGQDLLVEAYSRLDKDIRDNIEIDFYGSASGKDISYLRIMEEKCKKYNFNNICFKGFSEELYKTYQHYDVGVICSKSEAFGRVTVEYMAAGLCVIASNSGANLEIIKSGYNGILFDRENVSDLAEKIKYIYLNRLTIEQYGEAARDTALTKFTAEKNGSLMDELITNICSQ